MFILRILLFLVAVGSLVYPFLESTKGKAEVTFKLFLTPIVSFILLLSSFCISIVPVNNTGIKYSPFTGVSETTLEEGFNFKTPFDTVYTISTEVQERTIEGLVVQTKDSQYVTVDLNIKYQISKSNAFKVFKNYRTLENLHNNLMANVTQRTLEEFSTKYNVIDILGECKNELTNLTEQALKEKLRVEGVDFTMLTINDIDAGAAIEKAIQDEAVAKKAVETAQQNQEKAKIEAETKLIQAEGEAKANAVKTKALTDEVLTEMWINKWNGVLPQVSDSEGIMIDISSLNK